MATLDITLVPQLSDNYSYLLQCRETGEAAIVDCPDAEDMIAICEAKGIVPTAILNTHLHMDHIAGNETLKQHWPGLRVFGFAGDQERITGITDPLNEGETVSVGNATATVLCTFGHTIGHIAYHFADDDAVFCGDAMFVAGCGRIFEGTAAQMNEALQKLGALAPSTRVYCGHEYTASNIRFARSIEPDNEALKQLEVETKARRERNEPTIPSTIGREWETNPFLRVTSPAVQAAAKAHGADPNDPASVVGAIRALKNEF
jgi:hydroxyacylglutathione hydrolase